jgi:transcriptional regulator with XRE-family HTH domain
MKLDVRKKNPDPAYLRELIKRAGLSQREAARRIGVSERAMRYYLSGERDAPYPVQYALESLS